MALICPRKLAWEMDVLQPVRTYKLKGKEVRLRISTFVWGFSLLFSSMLIMLNLQGCVSQEWVSQKTNPIFTTRHCSCGPQSGCYRCFPLEGQTAQEGKRVKNKEIQDPLYPDVLSKEAKPPPEK